MKRIILSTALALVGLSLGTTGAKADRLSFFELQGGMPEAAFAGGRHGGDRAQRTAAQQARREAPIASADRPQRTTARSEPQRLPSLTGSSTQSGIASYYWQPQPLASGGRFNPDAMTAAHKTLAFGTRVRVTHAGNGRSVDVTINDRGPYVAGRIIDLSRGAASVIGMQSQGIAQVRMTVLGR